MASTDPISTTDLNSVLSTMMRAYGSLGDRGLDRRVWFADEVLLVRISDLGGLATYLAAKLRFLDDMDDLLSEVQFRDGHHEAAVLDFVARVRDHERPFDAAANYERLVRY